VREPGTNDETAGRMDDRVERLVVAGPSGDPERSVESFGEIADRDLSGQCL
jgi:hypothetical protein